MAAKRRDPGLQAIDDLEALIVRAHDERVQFGAPVEEIKRERPAAVTLARAVADQMRSEYLARTRHD